MLDEMWPYPICSYNAQPFAVIPHWQYGQSEYSYHHCQHAKYEDQAVTVYPGADDERPDEA